MMVDLLFKNCRIVDGTGAPWFRGDVAVRGDRVDAVGRLRAAKASRVVDLEDRYIAPGFIDMHSHSDLFLLIDPRAEAKIRQGVTTEVVGHCGASASPLLGEAARDVEREWKEHLAPGEVDWRTTREYLQRLEEACPTLNCAALVGHGTLREGVCGSRASALDKTQRKTMVRWLSRSLREGAAGLSTGLVYTPSIHATTDELIELCGTVRRFGGIYCTHMRSRSEPPPTAVEEVIQIARSSGCRCHIAHVHGKTDDVALIETARGEGLDVSFDQYPYTASSSGLSLLLPVWMKEGTNDEFMARLRDPSLRRRLERTETFPPPNTVVITRLHDPSRQWMQGKNLSEIVAETGQSLVDCLCDLLLQEEGRVGMVKFDQDEEGVRSVMKSSLAIVASDGSSYACDGPLRVGLPHPRSFGAFARMLGHYVREEGVLSLETAVRQMTSAPASRVGLEGRGVLKRGSRADLVVFDAETVKDTATYMDPFRYPAGILLVVVNGEIVLEQGRLTGQRPGKVLKLKRDGTVK